MGGNTLWGPSSRAIIFVSMSSAALVAPGKKGHKITRAYLISVINIALTNIFNTKYSRITM